MTPAQTLAKEQAKARREALELAMLQQLRAASPETVRAGFVREYQFHETRKWRFDMAWPAQRLALEVDGGTNNQGRHTRGAGFAADCTKINEAILLGWRVLRVTSDHIKSGQALQWVERAYSQREGKTG